MSKTSKDIFVPYSQSIRLVTTTFLLWGFITVINGFLLTELSASLNITKTEQQFLTYIFFGAFFLIGYPASLLIEKVGFREGLKYGLYIGAFSVFPMVGGARLLSYELVVIGTFVLATGITVLQVSANMYIIFLGESETAASRLLHMQAFNSFGTWLAPLIGTLIANAQPAHITDVEQLAIFKSELVVLPYVMFTVVFIGMAIFFNFSELPLINKFKKIPTNIKDDTNTKVYQYRHVVLGALAICCYVGAEVSIGANLGTYIIEELNLAKFSDLIGYIIPYYWGGAMVGRFVGAQIARSTPANKMLLVSAIAAAVLVLLSMMATKVPAMLCILAVGMFNSIMFPVIFYLGTNGMGKLSAKASGLLNSGIVGGAVILYFFNMIPDMTVALFVPIACYLYIALYGYWGYKYNAIERIGLESNQ